MIPALNIADWLGLSVVDRDGAKLGALEAVYYDTTTQEPAFITVKLGLLGSSRLGLVPLDGATVSPKSVHVAVDKKLVKGAPSIEVDGQLQAEDEPAVYAHYGLAYTVGSSGERRLGRR